MKKRHTTRPIKPLRFGVYYTTSLILTLIGLGTTVYLSISHYRVYSDIGYKSFCAISRAINCDTVSQSAYAVLWGMPLAVWGCIGYLLILALLVVGMPAKSRPRRYWATIQLITFLFCGFDLYLAWVSSHHIKSYCIMCLVTYAVNFALLYFAWLTRRRFNTDSFVGCLLSDGQHFLGHRSRALSFIAFFGTFVAFGIVAYPAYWHYSLPHSSAALKTGVTPEGRPWIGAASPELVIEEYSDYLCFQCAKMHAYLRDLVSRYPDKLRLVHYHFPMDKDYNPLVTKDFHDGAGEMALLALFAERHEKFWQMNDRLFELGRKRTSIKLLELSEVLDLEAGEMAKSIRDKALLRRLQQDIRSGFQRHITATPTFVINGKTYKGLIPADLLLSVVE
jgi:uncharacterized membrane protein/protein-disulfide isomerase